MSETTNDKQLKIAFFGTSDRSIKILNELKNNFDLCLCVTKNDAKVGRHQDFKETEVKKWAKENEVKVITVSGLKGYDLEGIIESLKYADIHFGIVADFSFIIPQQLIDYFEGKLINIHFSLLPQYRGASPVQFALLNGDDTTGITYHLLDRKMDTGKILHQIGYKISGKETSGDLYQILFDLASINLPEVINKYNTGLIIPRAQDESKASYTYSPTHNTSTFIYKEDALINWKNDPIKIERAIRGYNPWPISWTYLEELENNKKLSKQKLNLKEGLNKKQKVKIYEADVDSSGLLSIKTLQLEGKNKMDFASFENGYLQLEKPKK